MAITETRNVRFDQIDSLRGLAALLVVLHHCCGQVGGGDWWHFILWGHNGYPSRIFYYGYIGVDLFLVLSGFCLSWPLLAHPEKPFRLADYAKRRFWRIYPPYLLIFIVLLLAGWLCRASGDKQFALLGFAERLTPLQCVASLTLQMTHLLPVFWTLCLEARWYLLFPLVLWTARQSPLWPILLLSILISAVSPHTDHGPMKLLIYLPAFVAGVWAAQLRTQPVWQTKFSPSVVWGAGFLAFFALCLVILPPPGASGRGTLTQVLPTTGLFFFLLLWALEYQGNLPLPARILQRIGVFSYSLYLVHLPLLELGYALYRPVRFSHAAQLDYWICVFVPGIVAVSYLFYLVAEKPFLRTPGQTSLPVIRAFRYLRFARLNSAAAGKVEF